ncbi:MAG: hypothetical protein ACK4PR_11195 [Gammaproteobacteria bacterium]
MKRNNNNNQITLMLMIFLLHQFTTINAQPVNIDLGDDERQPNYLYGMTFAIYIAITSLFFKLNLATKIAEAGALHNELQSATPEKIAQRICDDIYQILNISLHKQFFQIEIADEGKIKFSMPSNNTLFTYMNSLIQKLANNYNKESIQFSYIIEKSTIKEKESIKKVSACIFDLNKLNANERSLFYREVITFIQHNAKNIRHLASLDHQSSRLASSLGSTNFQNDERETSVTPIHSYCSK